MSQTGSFKNQLSSINKKIAAKMADLQQRQRAVIQVLNLRGEEKKISEIKEKIKAIN